MPVNPYVDLGLSGFAAINTLLLIFGGRRIKQIHAITNGGAFLPLRNIQGDVIGYVEQTPMKQNGTRGPDKPDPHTDSEVLR